MPLIDERGRVFGRLNLIDALVAVFVLLLIPLAYLTVLLFRTPIPTITGVEPAEVRQNAVGRVRIRGQDLRPFLRARVGASEARFLVQSPTLAEIEVPQLAPGTYDVALFDEAQELVRRPDALTIVSAPTPPRALVWLDVVGTFTGLLPDIPDRITLGASLQPLAAAPSDVQVEVTAVQPAEVWTPSVQLDPERYLAWEESDLLNVRATLRFGCAFVTDRAPCSIQGQRVYPGDVLQLVIPPAPATGAVNPVGVSFSIEEVRPAAQAPVFSLEAPS